MTPMKKFLVIAAALTGLYLAVPTAITPVQACSSWNDVVRACRDDMLDAIRDVIRTERNQTQQRVNTVRDALQQCWDCATDVIRNGVRTVR
jgi:hypothetical protein